ncbi:carboxylesterase 15-like [Miscanthus floridulus]|uniref:carboxylesterase 15-like n=1 Tax=Miscanthus floridulus TaxID=154761 RepID=UPI00345782C7
MRSIGLLLPFAGTDREPVPYKGEVPSNLPVQWKDVVYNAAHALRLRMYRPTDDNTTTANNKLPVLVYFHGGGFCLCSFELPHFHVGALRLATELPALMLSTDYRLAPEHRLPAMHRDAEGRVFICGDSAGGNIAHHVTVQYGSGQLALDPIIRIAMCVLLWPFFVAEENDI